MHLHTIRTPDGATLRLRTWGSGSPRIFMIHGFSDGGYIWDRFAHELAASGPLAAIDLRGHGDSEHDPHGRYPMARHVADVVLALESLGAREPVIVGHSLGAVIGIEVCAALGSRAKGLVLAEGGPFLRQAALDLIRDEFKRQPWNWASRAQYIEWTAKRMPFAQREMLDAVAEHALRQTAEGHFTLKCDRALADAFESSDDATLCARLREIRCPKLLLRGAMSSVLSRAAALDIQALARDCRLVTIDRSGHALMVENSESVCSHARQLVAAALAPLTPRESAERAGSALRPGPLR